MLRYKTSTFCNMEHAPANADIGQSPHTRQDPSTINTMLLHRDSKTSDLPRSSEPGKLKQWTRRNRDKNEYNFVVVPLSILHQSDHDLSRQITTTSAASCTASGERVRRPERRALTSDSFDLPAEMDDQALYLQAGTYILLKRSASPAGEVYTYLGPHGESKLEQAEHQER